MRAYLMALAALASAAVTSFAPFAAAQEPYPSRPVTMVVPFSPGASNDNIGRYLADGLSRKWGRPVVVENRAGAGGAIGSARVARSPADGYTLLFMSSAYTTLGATTSVKELGFDPLEELTPVAMAAQGQFVLVVGPSVKANTLAEFIAEAKSRPMFAGTPGPNSGSHLATEAFNASAGVNIDTVAYKGGNEAALDLMAGRVDMYIGSVAFAAPFIKGGKMRALAIVSPDRSSQLPGVPAITEGGLKDAEFSSWWGVFAPARMPPGMVDKLNADINAIMSTPESRKFLEGLGAEPYPIAPAKFKDLVVGEIGRWKKLGERMKAPAVRK